MIKTRKVSQHSIECQRFQADNPEYKRMRWFFTGEIETHHAGGWGYGPYKWVVMRCNITIGCQAKLLASLSDIEDQVIEEETP